MTEAPLAGLRVLEFAQGAAAGYCGRQFALWGADVVLAEGAGGSAQRRLGPLWRRGEARGSAAYDYLAAGKHSIAVPSPSAAMDLLAASDVLITDDAEALGAFVGADLFALRAACPALIVVAVSPFGQDGPNAGSRATLLELQALSGYLSLNGPADGAPIAAPGRILDHAVGVSAFAGALGALIRRERDADGDIVDVSAFETVCGLMPYLREQHLPQPSQREGGTPEGARLLPCADGYVSVAISLPSQEAAFRDVLGIPGQADGASILVGERRAGLDRAWILYSDQSRRFTRRALAEALEARGVICGTVQSADEVLDDAQLNARGFFGALRHPEFGATPIAGRAAGLSGVVKVDLTPAPALHDTAIADLGWAPRSLRKRAEGVPSSPLAGVSVLDLTQAWIGPMAGVILADLGAEVIKVESVQRPDIWRNVGQAPDPAGRPAINPLNRSAYFNGVNRNKLGLGLNLSTAEGAAVFRELAGGCDVILENFTPRVMPKFGLDFGRLRQDNPKLVMTSFSGFGDTGPFADQKANGASIEALAGWDTDHLDEAGHPVLMGGYQADPICGLQMAACTLVALYRHVRTGQGGRVEGSMFEAAVGYVGDRLLAAALEARGARLAGDASASFVLPGLGADAWSTLTLAGEADWSRLISLPQAPARLSELRGQAAEGCERAAAAARETLADWSQGHDPEVFAGALASAGLASAAMRLPLTALKDPQLLAREWFYRLEAPAMGCDSYVGSFFRYATAPLAPARRAPCVGEDTAAVLKGRLGLTNQQVARLAAVGAAGTLA